MKASTIPPPQSAPTREGDADLALLARGIPPLLGRRFFSLLLVGSEGRAHAEGAAGVRAEDHDVIIVADGVGPVERRVRRRIVDRWVEKTRGETGVPVSPGILEKGALGTLPFTLFNYEMRYAHRVLAGEDPAALIPSYPAERLPLVEATRLLLNRGVPLWGDALALRAGAVSPADADRIALRHRKALLAVGDALLIAEGLYHWSYGERARRVARCDALRRIPGADLADRYAEALASKRDGSPAPVGAGSLRERTDALLDVHAAVFRYVEERRLGRKLGSWADYGAAPLEYPAHLLGTPARRIARLLRAFGAPRGCGFYRRHRGQAAEAVLLRAFPRYAYDGHAGPRAELAGTLNWRPPREPDPRALWERFHAVWARGQ